MANFKILLKKNLIEMIRNKRIIVFAFVFIALSLISALTAKYLPVILEPLLSGLEDTGEGSLILFDGTVADSYLQYISNFSEISVLLVGIMFVNTIVKEKSKGTYSNLKMNRVKDREIVLSHLVSQIILVTVTYLVSVAVFVLLNIILFKQIMGVRGFIVLLYIYLVMLVATCFSMFVSCLCKKSGKAYLLVILSYFVFGLLEILPKINRINPFHLITLSSNLMYYKEYSLNEHLLTTLSSVGICVVLVIVSLLVVKNRINNKRGNDNDIESRV